MCLLIFLRLFIYNDLMKINKKIIWRFFIILLILIIALEALTRLLGIADVPLRDSNSVTGYIPKSSQSGRFLTNDWNINAMQMISTKEFSSDNNEILLAGDSIIYGVNSLKQKNRVGEQLDSIMLDINVFTIADSSWGFKNSLNYLEANQEKLFGIERIIFILNSGDFGEPSSWRCGSFHPISKPVSHLIFAVRKYLIPQCLAKPKKDTLVKDYNATRKLNLLVSKFKNTDFIIFLYQNRNEYKNKHNLIKLLDKDIHTRVGVYQLIDYSPIWKNKYYSDGIHLTSEGTAALAKILKRVTNAN